MGLNAQEPGARVLARSGLAFRRSSLEASELCFCWGKAWVQCRAGSGVNACMAAGDDNGDEGCCALFQHQ